MLNSLSLRGINCLNDSNEIKKYEELQDNYIEQKQISHQINLKIKH